MSEQYLIAMLVCITAIASYINFRFFRLPKTIGLTIISLGISFLIMLLLSIGQYWIEPIKAYLSGIDFSQTVINGMLSFLLFAGAIHINAVELSKHKWIISTLATASVVITCLMIGYGMWFVASRMGIHLDLIYFLLFGALIAPTDPICVLNALKTCKVPIALRMKITGESLFNDAAGILLFVIIAEVLTGQTQKLNYLDMAIMIIQQGIGGIIYGLLLGMFVSRFIKQANHDETAILMTLALVTGGYTLSTAIGVSGPIAMVIAGLVVGSHCRKPNFNSGTVSRLYGFWELIDDMLNSFLFVMIGLEILSLNEPLIGLILGLIGFVILIFSRFISVILPSLILEPIRAFSLRTISIMTWGGMRGGLSIALALSMPNSIGKDFVISLTYGVVIASILIQGFTLKPVIQKLYP